MFFVKKGGGLWVSGDSQPTVSQCVVWPVNRKEKVTLHCFHKSLVFRTKELCSGPID